MSDNASFIRAARSMRQRHSLDAGSAGAQAPSGRYDKIVFSVTGTAYSAGVTLYDQAVFLSSPGMAANGSTYALATVACTTAPDFSMAEVADFISKNRAYLVNVMIQAASAAAVISGLTVNVIRRDPMGNRADNVFPATIGQTAQDYQTTYTQIPIGLPVDGYTWLSIVSPCQVSAATYGAVLLFSDIMDGRRQIPIGEPAVVFSPGS